MIQKKTDKVKSLLRSGEFEKALAIAKTFRLGFTSEQRRVLQIASEVLNGRGSFYAQLGIDTTRMVEDAKKILQETHIGCKK